MSNLTNIPLIDNYRSNLSQEWNGATGTVYVATTPTFTFPSGIKTYIVVDPGKTNMQIAEIDSYNSTNKTLNVSNITLEKGASVNSTAQTHTVGSEVIISDNYQFWLDILTAINSKIDTATGLVGVYATTTERDATITSPSNGMQVYVTGDGLFYDYTSGSWIARASGGTFPNASETVAGKVEVGTQTEVDNGTDTGGTGAINVVIPSTLDAKVFQQTSLINSGITGEIKIWTTATPPTNWLICDGSSLLRAGTYANLFAVIGTTYGTVDGTHFTLPNLKGKVVVGYNASETEFDVLGETGGAKTHTLTTNEIPEHTHTLQLGTNTTGSYKQFSITNAFVSDTSYSTLPNTTTGSGHNNLQPYISLNYIIRI